MNPHIRRVIAPLRRPLLAALLLACIAASGASRTVASDAVVALAATTYHVSPTGDNASSGSVKAPWRTLTYAAGRLSPGDVLHLRGGLYREKVKFRSSGTAARPIKIRAYPANATGPASTAAFTVASSREVAHSNTRIADNVIVQDNGQAIGSLGPPAGGSTFFNNIWSKSPPSSMMRGRGSIVGDPRLARAGSIAPGELTASYFKIGSRSPAIDAGADLAEVTGDYFGTSRPLGGAPGMGGDEYAPP